MYFPYSSASMDFRLTCKRMVIYGTLLIWAVKYVIRPLQLFDEPMAWLLGIAPNLLGSFLIPFGAIWFFDGRNHLLARVFRLQSVNDLKLVCLVSFALLVVNEYLQKIPFFGRTFDYADILVSAIGLGVSYFYFSRSLRRFRLQED